MNKTAEIHKAGYNCGLSIGLGNPVLFNFENDVRKKGIVIGYGTNMDGTINYAILPQTKIKNLSNGSLIRNVNTKHILNGFEYEDNYVFVGVENVFYVNESKPKEVFYGICFDPMFNSFKVEETKIDKSYVKIYKKKVNAMNTLNELNEKINAVKCFDIENLYTEEDIKKITEIVSNDVGNSRTVIYKNHYVKLVIETIGLEYKLSLSSNLHNHQVTRTEIISSIDLLVAKVSNAINLLTDSVLVVLDKNYRIINKKGE